MLRLFVGCSFAGAVAALSGEHESMSLLQLGVQKVEQFVADEPSCKESKAAKREAKANMKAAKKAAKDARAAKKAAQNALRAAKEALEGAQDQLEKSCPKRKKQTKGRVPPSCGDYPAVKMARGVLAPPKGLIIGSGASVEMNNGVKVYETNNNLDIGSCIGNVYKDPRCWDADYVWKERSNCWCSKFNDPKYPRQPRFIDESDFENEGFLTAHGESARRHLHDQWLSLNQSHAVCLMTKESKTDNSFSVFPPSGNHHEFLTRPCAGTMESMKPYAQTDTKKQAMLGNTNLWGCFTKVEAEKNGKCALATRMGYRRNGDCYCEWGRLTVMNTNGHLTNEEYALIGGSLTCLRRDILWYDVESKGPLR